MKKIIIASLLTIASCGSAFAADLKIGFVSVEKLLREAPQVEAVNTEMIERFGGKKEELEELKKEIETMQENYKRNELVMTEDKLNEMKSKMLGKLQMFKQKESALAQEVNTMRSQELAVLQKSVRDIINKIAKRDDYDLILSEGVVFATESLDITETVLEELKKDFKE